MSLPTTKNWREWHLPLSADGVTLREAYDNLASLGAEQNQIPLMVQLVENPKFDIPGFDLFHGAVNLRTHDLIHIILGRGLLANDEAFVIGFTMGSTNRVSTAEEQLFSIVSKYLYPKVYRFKEQAIDIFRDAVKLGYISDCQPLDEVDFDALLDLRLREMRERIGLETELLHAYFAIEARRYPNAKSSARLLQ
jgi:hypothetical protein